MTLEVACMPLHPIGDEEFRVAAVSRRSRARCLPCSLFAVARGDGEDDAGAGLLRIVIEPLINEAMSVYGAVAATSRFGELGRSLERRR